MTTSSQLLGQAPSFTGVARGESTAAGSIGDFNSGAFNVGGSSLASLALIAAGMFVLINLMKKGRK